MKDIRVSHFWLRTATYFLHCIIRPTNINFNTLSSNSLESLKFTQEPDNRTQLLSEMLIYYHETPGLEKSSPLTNLESQSVSSVALFSSTRSFTPPGSLKVYRQRKHTCNRRFVWTNALSVFLMVVILLNALVLYKSGTLKDLRNYKWKESMVRNPDLVLEKFKNTVNSDKYIDDGLHGIKGLDVLENLDEDDLWLN